ncbi:hypothetical protein METBIDRAFT_78302 [Metschnikowia bicuspidata var. bicuspidata NRRL YB-4993]|uniref:SAGA complex subunit Spt7 n=1 Tax=Metschnikowia bicuspidata var. bicuspidata NRRL YB-4993 TaxID=869754 RepID=A0A1A0HBN8_9ASCO|nr:hypothetical protein METBIDRAFT_78302 [Metschnikowia bicuspidata var. bicuspidata NRRL YB-4993]OBA21292.1 hypothetical protein METBIDRAFT_78302 [Metschnikowia bicuspidata var. bicuspidata NRRL YB-4993]
MDKLSTFQANDLRRLFELAKKLHQKEFFKEVLNNFQYQIVKHVFDIGSFELWRELLEGNCSLKIDWPNEDKLNQEEEQEALEEGVKPIRALALNLRFLLWEKAIDFFYAQSAHNVTNSRMYNIEHSSEDYQLIELLEDIPQICEEVGSNSSSHEHPKKVVRAEEDDYDDEEEDDDEEESSKAALETSKQDPVSEANENFERSEEDHIVLHIPSHLFQAKASEGSQAESYQTQISSDDMEPAAASLEDRDLQIINFNKIYHNFEYDRETLIKRRKLEKSDMQIENLKSTEGGSSEIQINFGAASHSLKHLLNTIRDKRDNISLTDLELRSLFLDIRKNRGKWANDDRVGQEELYEACEKVLLDLRGYTEHSTPFLNKVSKREAPNYGLIIKKPMDLNTVLKKLKSLAYQSKSEFVDDLMLIWNNCLMYNADPKHFLRAHASAMQKRTLKLAPSIPDIVIRNRSDIEKDDDGDTENMVSSTVKGGKSSKKGQMRRREEVVKSEDTEAALTDQLGSGANTYNGTPATPAPVDTIISENGSLAPTNEENGDEEDEDADEGDADEREEDNDDIQDAELQAWKVFTAKSRANYCSSRAALFDEDFKLKMDAEAIVRESKKMSDFNHFLDNKEVVSKGNKLLDNDEPYLLEYDIAGGVPEIPYPGIDDHTQENYENRMAETFVENPEAQDINKASGLIVSQNEGLNKAYTQNITEVQEIRRICFKISLIRQMQTQQFMHRTQMRQPEIEHIREVDIDPVSKLPNHDIYSPQVQYAALRKSIAKIAMHTGFETTEQFAINTLTQVAERYMLNLAKSMKLHCESTSRNTVSASETLLLTLLENGVEKPDDLFTFVQEKVKKTEAKLKDLRSKLSGFLKELLRPSLEKFNEKNFDDNSEQFTTGDFTSELGDDFFGFKELGLDKEFNMLSSSVPVYLLHARLHNSFNNAGPINKTTKYEDLREWKQIKLRTEDVGKQIGILQMFYQGLAQRTEANYVKQQKRKGEVSEQSPASELYLIEDEELPQKQRNIRPRLPPNGKILSVKKKPLTSVYVLPEEEEQDDNSLLDFPESLDEVKMEA